MQRKRKVLMVTEYFPPHWTGIAKSFYVLAHHLLAEGHDVHVLTTQFDPKTPPFATEEGVPVTRVPYQFAISRTHYSYSIIGVFARMLAPFDTVIINSPNSNIFFYSIITKLFRKKLIIYHQADIVMPRQTGSLAKSWIMERIFDMFTLPSMFLADRVSTFTQDYAQHSRVMRYSLHKFQAYIPEVRLSHKPPSTAFLKKMDSLKKSHVLLGISGRFVEEKGFDVLFAALPLILKAYPSAHLVFAGQKTLAYEPFYDRHKELFESQSDHITFLGLLDEGNLAVFYEALDVFVLSSRSECFALTQIDAWQKHVPIVVTDVPGARQLVKNSGFGEIVPAEDPRALADGVIKVLQKRSQYTKKYAQAGAFLHKYAAFKV